MSPSGTRVLVVNPGINLGGAEHSLLLLMPALREQGVEIVVAVFGDGPFRQRAGDLGFETIRLHLPRRVRRASRYRAPVASILGLIAAGLPAAMRLETLVKHERIDLLHTNGAKAHLIGGIAGRMARVPTVWHLRDFPPSGITGRLLRRAASSLPAAVLANSQAVASSYFEASRSNVFVAPNPVDLELFHENTDRDRLRQRLGLRQSGPIIGQIAHLTPWKGHEQFLSIAREVLDHIPDASFAIAGGAIYETDGHAGYEDRLRRRASDLGIADRVAFLGQRDDVADVLSAIDLLLHCPTAPEPFGRVLAEAMAAGRAVVASRSGGAPEVVSDGITGTLVPPGDIHAFATAAIRLLEDPGQRCRFGRAARSRAEVMFRLDTHVAHVLDAYQVARRIRTVAA